MQLACYISSKLCNTTQLWSAHEAAESIRQTMEIPGERIKVT